MITRKKQPKERVAIAASIVLSLLLVLATSASSISGPMAYADTTSGTGIIVPLYTYPTSSTWDEVINIKTDYPSVPIIAVINPADGPGSYQNSDLVSGIGNLHSAGITVLGYVNTHYGSRSSHSVKKDISTYISLYNIDGIFFDEMSNTEGNEHYYQSLSNYAKSLGFTFTIGNPGADVPSSYIGTVDNIVIYEDSGLPNISDLEGWHASYDKTNFSIIAHSVDSLDKSFVSEASNYVGYMYITDNRMPNPYHSLPSYFDELASVLSTADGGTSSSSSDSTPSATYNTLKIESYDLDGNSIHGIWTTISHDGNIVKTGYTPLSFDAESGVSYKLTVYDYGNYAFDHWGNGSTSRTRTINISEDATIPAYYNTNQ
jgi:spherulation-specific family 4 protein